MALYDTRFGLPQAVVDYLNQGLPNIYQSITQPSITPINFDEPTSSNNLDETVAPIIQATRGGGGGGDSYSVYNPDPSTISNREYSPYAYRQAMAKSGVGIPSGILSDSKFLYGPQLTGIPGAIAASPIMQLIGKAASGLESLLPVNRRAIYENELAGQGIMVNDIGQIVQGQGDYNTAQNIMAGYNANMIDASTIQNRIDTINEKMKDPDQKKAKLDALYEFAKINNIALDRTTSIFDDKSLQKDPTYKSFDNLVTAGLLEGDDDDENEFDPTDPKNFFKLNPISRKKAIDQEISNRNAEREIAKRKAIENAAKKKREMDAKIASAEKLKEITQPQFNPKTTSGGAGTYNPSLDHSGDGGYGHTSSSPGATTGSAARSRHNRSSDLGFSDIRLKENIELIGKSPSNINIYKFNYKNNPTTYQGAMAHEVLWASVKHSNGYMMVDYNLLDVDFKKYNA